MEIVIDILKGAGYIVAQVLTAILIGLIAAVIVATYKFFVPKFVHRWGKLRGKSYIILSGDPETVQQMYQICINVGERVTRQQAQAKADQTPKNEGIDLNEETVSQQTEPKA